MAIPDLSNLSSVELTEVIKTAQGLINKKQAEEKKAVLQQMKELAAKNGMTLEEVLGRSGAGKRAVVAPKYRNPANPNVTWSGRGRKPKWVEAVLASGKSLADIAI